MKSTIWSIGLVMAGAVAGVQAGTAVRTVGVGEALVEVAASPGAGVMVYVVEEELSAGVVPREISHDGVFDVHSGVIKWGPFLDGQARVLSYRVVTEAAGEVVMSGGLTEPGGVAGVTSGDASLAVGDAGLEGYVVREFGGGGLDRPEGQVEADEDGDGWPLVVEYALGMDPRVTDDPVVGLSFAAGTGDLQVDLRRREVLPDVSLELLGSSDLSVWSNVSIGPGEVVSDHGDGVQTFRYTVVVPDGGQFVMWRVGFAGANPTP